mmetsp:Transcript_4397/g.10614  ORF Transcript_4397/g.10614 Transcript_4397/m.10614 type:complete len:259 (-) Transcript_4397:137-913(-)
MDRACPSARLMSPLQSPPLPPFPTRNERREKPQIPFHTAEAPCSSQGTPGCLSDLPVLVPAPAAVAELAGEDARPELHLCPLGVDLHPLCLLHHLLLGHPCDEALQQVLLRPACRQALVLECRLQLCPGHVGGNPPARHTPMGRRPRPRSCLALALGVGVYPLELLLPGHEPIPERRPSSLVARSNGLRGAAHPCRPGRVGPALAIARTSPLPLRMAVGRGGGPAVDAGPLCCLNELLLAKTRGRNAPCLKLPDQVRS